MTYTVKFSNPTGIPGYLPEWTTYTGDDFVTAYEWVMGRAKAWGAQGPVNEAVRMIPDYGQVYAALRDGQGVTVEVYRAYPGLHLGHGNTPELLGTITVAVS
jgi:hypothetical protein